MPSTTLPGGGVTSLKETTQRGTILDDYIYLRGYPPMDSYLSFIKAHLGGGKPINNRPHVEAWREGNDYVGQLQEREAGIAQGNEVLPLPEHLHALRDEVWADPVITESFDKVPTHIGLVEIDRISVYQRHLNMTYVDELAKTLSPDMDDESVFRFCLLDPPQPTIKMAKVASNGFVFVSPSNDLRYLGSVLLERDQIADVSLPGRAGGVVGLIVGAGSNCLSVMEYEGRFILHNGTHRTAALRKAGFTHIPVIVQRVSLLEELEFLFGTSTYERLEKYMELGRPPMFKDYFDPNVTSQVKVPRRLTQVKVTYGSESIEVPIV